MRRLPAFGLILTLVGLLSSTVVAAGPQPNRHERPSAAPKIDLLRANQAQLARQLRVMNTAVLRHWQQLVRAERQEARARRTAARLKATVAAKENELRALRRRVKQMVVQAYVDGTDVNGEALLSMAQDTESQRARALLEVSSAMEAHLVADLQRAQAELVSARRGAERALGTARQRRQLRRRVVGDLGKAVAGRQRLARALDQRLGAALADAAAQAARNKALVARAASSPAGSAAGPPPAVAAAPAPPAPPAPPAAPVRRVAGSGGSGGLAEVRGIVVSAGIASQLAALLSAADAAGVALGGGGYRDPSAQIAVRRSNCGSSHYAIYQMPASQCSPTTARPGSSMHEQGLAIDFTVNGSSISGRSNPAFRWLAANAARFGFHNLPSEPWHWSVNGN